MIFVLVDLHEGADRVEAFARRVAAAPEVLEVHQVSGRLDVLLRINVERFEHYQRFADIYLNGDANIRDKQAMFVLRTVKEDL